ncbi:hypothetical protein H1C71_038038, partial [Ictidomys tridecemlineatus]
SLLLGKIAAQILRVEYSNPTHCLASSSGIYCFPELHYLLFSFQDLGNGKTRAQCFSTCLFSTTNFSRKRISWKESYYAAQAYLELLVSSDPPASVSQVDTTIGSNHCTQIFYNF